MDPSGYICCYQVSCLNRYIQTNSIVQHEIQIKNRIIKHVNVYVKIIVHAKENSSWNPSTKYLSILCPMKLYMLWISKMTNSVQINVTSTMIKNTDDRQLKFK